MLPCFQVSLSSSTCAPTARQILLQPLLGGLARALAAPRAFSVADNMKVISTKSLSMTDDTDLQRATVEEYGRVTAMRAAILGAMACLCERSPTNTLMLGSLSGTVSDIARVAEKASVGRCSAG